MKGKGIQAAELQIDWPELMRFKRSFTEPVPKRREDDFAKAGIAAFHGAARFAAPTTVQVGEETLTGRYVVIATGRVPADLDIPGAECLTTSDQFLELDELPRRILFIGGGYIAFEFAHVAARAGSQITVLHRGPRPGECYMLSPITEFRGPFSVGQIGGPVCGTYLSECKGITNRQHS
jgi:glutathione reductase (NADPH)